MHSYEKILLASAWSGQRKCKHLTLNVRGPCYLGLTRSISLLLMSWLLTLLGHQQPWYWLCRMGRSLSYLRKYFNHPCHINVEEWHKNANIHMFYVPAEKFSMKRVNYLISMLRTHKNAYHNYCNYGWKAILIQRQLIETWAHFY